MGKIDLYSVIFNSHDVVLMMTSYQCTLYAILLFATCRMKDTKSNMLAAFLLCQAAIPLDILINFGSEFRSIAISLSPNIFYLFGLGYWLSGPFLLWYVRSAIYAEYKIPPKQFLYLIPFLLYLVYEWVFYYRLPEDTKIQLLLGNPLETAPKYMNLIILLREAIRLIFLVVCIRELSLYSDKLKDNFSEIRLIDMRWLRVLIYGFFMINVIAVLVSALIVSSVYFSISLDYEKIGLTANYLTFLLVSTLVFFSLKHSSMVGGIQNEKQLKSKDGSGFDESDIDKLLTYMDDKKPFLIPSLSINELSGAVDLPKATLSSVINRKLNSNFFEFVNGYRINFAKYLLENSDLSHMDISEVRKESGFSSKTTFNKLFREQLGVTPSTYRKAHSKKSSS